MRPFNVAILALALGAAVGCAEGPIETSTAPQITFMPPAVINPGAGANATIRANVTGADAGATLRWLSLNPAVVVVEPMQDQRKAVLHFADQRSAAVEVAVIGPQGMVAATDTLRIASISAIAPMGAPRR